jgi:hypothetical protein
MKIRPSRALVGGLLEILFASRRFFREQAG